MFKIEFLVQDKKLGDALRAAAPYSVGPPIPTLVKNHPDEESDDSLRVPSRRKTPTTPQPGPEPVAFSIRGPRKEIGERLPDKVAQLLIDHAPPKITGEVVRAATVEAGGQPNSYSYIIVALRKIKFLEGPDRYGEYTMHPAAYEKLLEEANG